MHCETPYDCAQRHSGTAAQRYNGNTSGEKRHAALPAEQRDQPVCRGVRPFHEKRSQVRTLSFVV